MNRHKNVWIFWLENQNSCNCLDIDCTFNAIHFFVHFLDQKLLQKTTTATTTTTYYILDMGPNNSTWLRYWLGLYFYQNSVNLKSNGILLPKLFWPTVRKKCSSDREILLKLETEGREFAKILRSLEQFIQTVKGQNNFL